MSTEFSDSIASIDQIIEDARNGRMYILVDAEDRENEGDLIIPAQFATPDAVNYMAKHGRGLICLSLTKARADALQLDLMTQDNRESMGTAFTVSIEAADGVTTGISAHDRARTIQVAIDPASAPHDLVKPGHVFPLIAKDGGVLVRAGHTEAAVDISRAAGLFPSGVICEIMSEDGSMARLPELVEFAKHHGLNIGTIADLIAWRQINDSFLERAAESELETAVGGRFRAIVFENKIDGKEHLALVRGDLAGDKVALVRMHRPDMLKDIIGAGGHDAAPLDAAMLALKAYDGPVIVVILNSMQDGLLAAKMRGEAKSEMHSATMREYGVGAQILRNLGARRIQLLTRQEPSVMPGLDGYGITIEGWQPY